MYTCMTEAFFHTSYLAEKISMENLFWIVRNTRKLDPNALKEVHLQLSRKLTINKNDISLLEQVYQGLSESEKYLALKYGVPRSTPLEKAHVIDNGHLDCAFLEQCIHSQLLLDNSGAIVFLDVILKPCWLSYFQGRIVNAHSAILPYARGMYAIEQLMTTGSRENIEKAAGATIHYVDSGIDTGKIITFKKIKSLWSLPSIWAVKGESYLLAFDLMSSYLKNKSNFSFQDVIPTDESLESPLFYSKNFTEDVKLLAEKKFHLYKLGE